MKSNFTLTSILLLATLCPGCAVETKEQTAPPAANNKTSNPQPDDENAVKALAAIGAQTKTDDHGHVTEVNLRDTEATDETLAGISGLKHVQSLLLNDLPVTDVGLAALSDAGWPLTNLDLRGCAVSNAGLDHIVGFSSLKALRLSGSNGKTTVDDGGAAAIAQLPNLKVLALDRLKISSDGLHRMLTLNNLEEFYLAETAIDDNGLALIPQFEHLKKLRLSHNQITDAGIAHLANIVGLVDLDLSENSRLSDAGMMHLSGLKKLKKLNLWSVPIGDAGVRELADLTDLAWLNLDNTQLTDDGLGALRGMSQLKFLHLGSTQISDTGLSALSDLTGLKDLKVTRTAVTEEGVSELKKSLSGTAIQLEYMEN